MLTFLIILGLVAAASTAALYLRRTNRSSEMLERQAVSGAENFRPLFEPSKEELLTEQNEKKRLHAYARLTTEQIHLYLQVPT